MCITVLIFTISLHLMQQADCKHFTLEAEDFAPQYMRMPRNNAYGNFSTLLNQTDVLHLDFCLRSNSVISVANIRYSNDGPIDEVFCSVDGQPIGSFQTAFIQNSGQGWNLFHSSGPLAGRLTLSPGRHYIAISATTDQWGVEIDHIMLNISDDKLGNDDLRCNEYCFDDIRYDNVPRYDELPSGRFVQNSIHTRCSEVDNVNIQIFHDTATEFEIVASLPKYVSFANFRDPYYDNCNLGSPFWMFKELIVETGQKEVVSLSNTAVLQFVGNATNPELLVIFDFDKLDKTREVDEMNIGSILTLRLQNMPKNNVKVRPEYFKLGSWVLLPELEYNPFTVEHSWNIPDSTWQGVDKNRIRINIKTGQQRVVVDKLRLDRRPTSDTTFDMYVDPDTVVQGVRLGFWHNWSKHSDSMAVSVRGEVKNTDFLNVDSIRIYAKVPWTGGFSQIFVMFQDGRTRMQTITPHGLDYIPFGSSVTIGQPMNPSEPRPYVPIRKIMIEPKRKILEIEFMDGNSANIQIKTSFTETRMIVKNAIFKRNRQYFPLMTFRSMWINDGHSDVDHIIVNGGRSRHIMSDWRELFGNSAAFFRKCISVHNTQGPDVQIQFLGRK